MSIPDPSQQIDDIANEIVAIRKRPLFVMFYDETSGKISHDDVRDVHDEFRRRGWSMDAMHENLDILIHSWGGDADASYRISQVIHDFTQSATFLVPFHATSGATLISLGGNEIRLGAYASLSPIDVRLGDIELASIDNFKKFAIECRKDIEEILQENHSKRTTNVESELLCKMVEQEGALGIGSLSRATSLTGHYAYRLMYDYMFASHSNRHAVSLNISNGLLYTYPSHNFVLDFHMSSLIGLPVIEMHEQESDKTKEFVDLLNNLSQRGIICRDIGEDPSGETLKAPFFRLYV